MQAMDDHRTCGLGQDPTRQVTLELGQKVYHLDSPRVMLTRVCVFEQDMNNNGCNHNLRGQVS